MANDEEDHALVADEVAPTEFALMANTSAKNKVFNNSLCSKDCKKNNDSINSKITDLTDKLFDAKNMIYHYKLGLAQVESRLVEYKERKVKYYEKIRTLEFRTESNNECIEILRKKLETLKQEKEGVDGKLAGLLTASKDLDNLIESQRANKNKEGLGYSAVPPPPAQIYSSLKKDLKRVKKSFTPKPVAHRPYRPPVRPVRTNMNGARPNRTSLNKQEHSYANRPFHRTLAVRSHYRAPWIPTVNKNFPPVNRKFSTGSRNFPTANRKFPTASRKFPDGSTKCFTVDIGMKGKAVKPSACWFWKPSQNLSNKGPNNNSVSVMFKKYTYIDTQGRLNGCSRHMTGNISYLSDYEPFDRGYVSFGQGGCKITGKGTIKTGKLKFENVYFVKDLKHNLVRGLPTKCFENDHTCTACLKGKQHKASCKSKLVKSMTKPLHTLHMDLFGPTSDETRDILKKFIIEIENLKELKVKIIRCDNGGEFRNKEMNDFCSQKEIKREFSNARTPQQNGVAERRNKTLIKAAKTMLVDAKLPVTFWAEAVNTACYVQTGS
nr:hypothetical protein [Tanacetum cinerariifolium]